MNDFNYKGDELDIFKDAVNWKKYWFNSISKFISGDVLEVGAGIGINTNLILQSHSNIRSLLSIEPDKSMADQILSNLTLGSSKVTVLNQYLQDFSPDKRFDTIIYIDVIEHIEDDAGELRRAKLHLKDGGILIILVPSYNFLISPFDEAIGHYRRYNKKMIVNTIPDGLTMLRLFYLDSVGVCASLLNKFVLKQSYPTREQILKYDKMIVPLSKVIDPLIFHSVGKSLVGVWKK
ncbi:Methyltransferase domain-containing protein [Salinimicrobium sediminis]|uniref:Methyltransferase domain-containing protein n=1 Tax=Salinimicrobium sediminis TaxID=1343891 RepID=A0A285WZU7_9FLAO|nr:class I SAM-dependent methyltransferase [Salinimicrobium sediminis]SOC78578.1 Methyltransferase domain-containing protein [Salinimicrobium sediminis]